jgi:Tfp pilus assembly major pilin PilA
LLELLIVIIIVGVLASVALPSYFRNVERARSTEAFQALGLIKRGMEACAMQFNGDYNPCFSFNAIGMTDPSGGGGSHFTYNFGPSNPFPADNIARLTATRNALDNGDGSSYISFRIDIVTKQIGICTLGVFATSHPNNPPGICDPGET